MEGAFFFTFLEQELLPKFFEEFIELKNPLIINLDFSGTPDDIITNYSHNIRNNGKNRPVVVIVNENLLQTSDKDWSWVGDIELSRELVAEVTNSPVIFIGSEASIIELAKRALNVWSQASGFLIDLNGLKDV